MFGPAWATGRFDIKALRAEKRNEKGCEEGDEKDNENGDQEGNERETKESNTLIRTND